MRVTVCAGIVLTVLISSFATGNSCTPTTSNPELDVGAEGVGRFYIDKDCIVFDVCFFSVWVYAESNGIEGLQRDDEVKDDTCNGQIPSDTSMFPE